AALTITAKGESKTYGTTFTPDSTSQFTTSGLVNGDSVSSVTLTSSGYAAAATVGSPYAITASTAMGSGLKNYTISYVNGMLIVNPAPLPATGVNFSATAGTPFSGTLATFTNVSPNTSPYTALIDWGDGSTSTVSINVSGSSPLMVTGAHTYVAPKSYTVTVQISNPNTTTAKLSDTATVTGLGQGVVKGLAGGIGFWDNSNGQALIKSFNGGSTATTLSAWLAATFPNLYGASAGANNLTG